MNEFKVGDRVAIAVAEHESVMGGRAGVTNKDEGIIDRISGIYFYIKWLTGRAKNSSSWSTTAKYLKLAPSQTNRNLLHFLKK